MFFSCAGMALTPKIFWKLEKLRLSLTIKNADDVQPSNFYLIIRKFFIYAGFTIALALILYSIKNIIIGNFT